MSLGVQKPLLGVHKTLILSYGVQELVPQCGVWHMKYFKVKEFETSVIPIGDGVALSVKR